MSQRVFVTGGASGLGRAIALRYAQAGAQVCIGDINDQLGEEALAQLQQYNDAALYLPCDVTHLGSLEQVRETLLERWNGVDIVVNNAGVGGTSGGIEVVSLDDWEWVLNINLLGVVRGCRAFTPVFKTAGQGYFVNVASAAGLMNAPRMASYNASKSAVVSLSETLRVELASSNIGVSVVCPSFFPTNLTQSLRSHDTGTQDFVEKLMKRSPISADDIAVMIVNAVEKHEFWVLPHTLERRMWRIKRWWPEFFFRQMQKRAQKLIPRKAIES